MKESNFPKWGFGAIVTDDPDVPWVKSNDYLELLDICTKELGIHYLDSGQIYGDCEEVMGRWFSSDPDKSKRNSVIVGSKVSGRDKPSEEFNPLTGSYVFEIAQASRKKICTDCLDIYWLHGPDEQTPWEDTFSGFDQIVKENIAKEIGISNVSPTQIEEILSVCEKNNFVRPTFVQNQFNLLHQQYEKETLALCRKEGLHFMAYSPLAGGILTGKYQFDVLPQDSRWGHWEKSRGLPPYWTEKTFAAIDKLKEMANKHRVSMAGISLAWVSHSPGIGTTLLGPKHKGHLGPIKEAQNISLSNSEIEEIGSIFSGVK